MAKKTFKTKIEEIDWEGEQTETDTIPLVNNGSGKPIIMRVFDFSLPPIDPQYFPTKQQLLDYHKTKITAFLWRDELVPITDMRLIFSKDKLHFRIFSACQAKTGSVILEKPEVIQHYLNNERSDTNTKSEA